MKIISNILFIILVSFLSVFIDFSFSCFPNLIVGIQKVSHFIFEPQHHMFLMIYLYLVAVAFMEYSALSYLINYFFLRSGKYTMWSGIPLFLIANYLVWVIATFIGTSFIIEVLDLSMPSKIHSILIGIPLSFSISSNWIKQDPSLLFLPWNSHVNFSFNGCKNISFGWIILPLELILVLRILVFSI